MGAGASALLPAECTKDDARAFAGERWNETMDQKFDAICRDGKISKELVLQHEHSFGLEIRDWRRIAEHAHQLTEAAVKEAPPILEVDVEQITGNKAATRLQGASRKTAAYNESKIKVAKRINCSLEHAAERKQNKLDAFMSKLTEKMDTLEEQGQSNDQLLDTIDKMRRAGWPMNLPKDDHPGMDLPSPLTKDAMCELMERRVARRPVISTTSTPSLRRWRETTPRAGSTSRRGRRPKKRRLATASRTYCTRSTRCKLRRATWTSYGSYHQ
jgi:hypothetical protein